MIAINTIDHINIEVSRLDKSIKFYQEVFDFEVKEAGVSSMSGSKYAIIGISGKVMLALVESEEDLTETRLNHFGINVLDFDMALSVIQKLKIPTGDYGDAQNVVAYPKSRSIYVLDPDGNEIELSSNFGGGL